MPHDISCFCDEGVLQLEGSLANSVRFRPEQSDTDFRITGVGMAEVIDAVPAPSRPAWCHVLETEMYAREQPP